MFTTPGMETFVDICCFQSQEWPQRPTRYDHFSIRLNSAACSWVEVSWIGRCDQGLGILSAPMFTCHRRVLVEVTKHQVDHQKFPQRYSTVIPYLTSNRNKRSRRGHIQGLGASWVSLRYAALLFNLSGNERNNYTTFCTRLSCSTLLSSLKRNIKHFDQTYWLEERHRLRCRTVEDTIAVSQKQQSVKHIEYSKSGLVNRKNDGATSSWQSRHKTVGRE